MKIVSKQQLKNLPKRDWDAESIYDSILIIPSGKKHDSGWALMYIIGVISGEPFEIAAACDDINWQLPAEQQVSGLRTDMIYPSGVIHFWSNHYRFKVGHSLSSTDIHLISKF